MGYVSLFEKHKDDYTNPQQRFFLKLCREMDSDNVILDELTFDEFAEIIGKLSIGTSLSTRTLQYYNSSLKSLYQLSNLKIPDWLCNMKLKQMSEKVINQNNDFGFFKDIESIIFYLDKLNWEDYILDVKTICILAWHGITIADMTNIKKEDVDLKNNTIKTSRRGVLHFSEYEMNIIRQYYFLEQCLTPKEKRELYIVVTDYLIRPFCIRDMARVQRDLKITQVGIRQRLIKVNKELTERGYYPTLIVKKLLVNGDFYRVYQNNLSPFVFNKSRQLQYNIYVKQFYEESGE